MKLKDFLGKVIENKKNKQLNVNIKKGSLNKFGISQKDLFDMNVDIKLKKLMVED